MGSWPSDPGVRAYVEERLKRGIHRGIGEFHLSAADVGAPTLRRIAELARSAICFSRLTWTSHHREAVDALSEGLLGGF